MANIQAEIVVNQNTYEAQGFCNSFCDGKINNCLTN